MLAAVSYAVKHSRRSRLCSGTASGSMIHTRLYILNARQVQVVIGVGMLAALSYAVKQFVAPRVSQWYHEWRHDADKAKAEEEQQKTAQLVATAIQSQVGPYCLRLTVPLEWRNALHTLVQTQIKHRFLAALPLSCGCLSVILM